MSSAAPTRLLPSHPASFRDPSGFLFRNEEGRLLRQVNWSYQKDFEHLVESGLYQELVDANLLIEHEVVNETAADEDAAFQVIAPRELPFVSYPYEWAFSGLKAAALLTLELQKRALKKGMQLKDASAYNVQFEGARPIFIDTLSFEKYEENTPWVAYGQFCRHFLAPLALMAKTDVRLQQLLAQHIDGVPLDLASRLLPWSSWLSLSLGAHLHWHARMVQKHSNSKTEASAKSAQMSLRQQELILDNLTSAIESLNYRAAGTEWADYYADTSYSNSGLDNKGAIVGEYLDQIQPTTVWDLGANTGRFSQLASQRGAHTIAFDIDPACVERNFQQCGRERVGNMLPLVLDLTNPSSSIGWAHAERESLAERGQADCVMALALVHHLAISNNVPLPRIAEFFASIGKHLIIEWVPKQDPQSQRLLRSRRDVFPDYRQQSFEQAFAGWFDIQEKRSVGTDGRVLYRMRSKCSPLPT